jgi:hypothetical protein
LSHLLINAYNNIFATQAVAGLPLSSREERAERRVRSWLMLRRQRKSAYCLRQMLGQNIVVFKYYLTQNGVETPAHPLKENET